MRNGWLKAKAPKTTRGNTGSRIRQCRVDTRAHRRRRRLNLRPAAIHELWNFPLYCSADSFASSGNKCSGVITFLYPVAMSRFNQKKEPRANKPEILSGLRASADFHGTLLWASRRRTEILEPTAAVKTAVMAD